MTNHRPHKPVVTIELNATPQNETPSMQKFTLHYDHKDFTNAQHALREQGINVTLLGPGSIEFWADITQLIEGDKAERLRSLLKDEEGKVLLLDIDWWKVDILLYVGLFRSFRGNLSFDMCQDFITMDPVQQAQVASTVIPAGVEALRSYLKPQKAPEVPEAPLASGSGGEGESPTPEASESPSGSSGT